MWLGLVIYFGLIALRTALNYHALRRYLKLPLIDRPATAEHRASIDLQEHCETFWERLLLPFARQQSFMSVPYPEEAIAVRVRGLAAVRSDRSTSKLLQGTGQQLLAGGFPTLLGLALSVMALPCAVYGLATGSVQFELAAVVTWLISFSEMALWQVIFQAPISFALLQPLAAVLAWAAIILGLRRS